MGRTAIACGMAVIALSLSAACGGRLLDGVYEGVDAGALGSLDSGVATGSSPTETGSSLKCMGGDCAGEICCASVTLDPAGGLAVSSAASACSATPCAMGQYQLCASDSECFEAGCVESPLGAGPNICARACTPGETQCVYLPNGVQTCTARYQWTTMPCSGDTPECMNGACVECTLGTSQCSGDMVQNCDPTGHWSSTLCPTNMRCANGICM